MAKGSLHCQLRGRRQPLQAAANQFGMALMENITNDDIKWLLELLETEGLSEIEVAVGDCEVIVKAAGSAAVAAVGPVPAAVRLSPGETAAPVATLADPENTERLLAPMAGIFYRSSSPDNPPYAEEGDVVEPGDALGLIEAMKLYNEVTSHIRARVVRFLVENEQHIEADQPLVLLEHLPQ